MIIPIIIVPDMNIPSLCFLGDRFFDIFDFDKILFPLNPDSKRSNKQISNSSNDK